MRAITVARNLAGLVLGLSALSCQPSALALESLPPDEPWPAAAPSPAAPSPAVPRLDPERQARARELLALAAERSGLPRAAPLPVVSLSRAQLAAAAVAQTERDLPAATLAAYSTLLSRLELAPPGFDYLPALSQLLAARSVALYDPERRRIAVAERLPRAAERAALAHELAHLLQDQSFELERRLADPALGHDARGALLALSEGAATLLGEELVARGGDASSDERALSPADDSVSGDTGLGDTPPPWPPLLARSLAATYADGESLVRALHAEGGWSAVHRLLAAPPATTAQILHLERLSSAALAVAVPEPPAPGWKLTFSDALGEQTLRVMLEEALSPEHAGAAASGWAGDRVALFRSESGSTASVWHIVLQGDAAAERLFAAVREVWLSALDSPGDARHWCRPQRDGGLLGAVRQGQSVVLLSLETAALAEPGGCASRLDEWASMLAPRSTPLATRVGTASPVATDPAPERRR